MSPLHLFFIFYTVPKFINARLHPIQEDNKVTKTLKSWDNSYKSRQLFLIAGFTSQRLWHPGGSWQLPN